jgi:integrase
LTTNEKRTAQKRRSPFGNVRKTAAGSFQARYTAPDGTARKGDRTFATKREATEFLARVRTQQVDGDWADPRTKVPTLTDFVDRFQASRVGRGGGPIKPRTLQLSEDQFARYILPKLGDLPLNQITPQRVNDWWLSLPPRPSLRRQLYSLLKATMNFAIRDGQVKGSNPCQIKGAGQNHYDERPHMSLEQVDTIIDALPDESRTLALLAFNAHLRLGEVLALRAEDLNLQANLLVVRRGVTEVGNQQIETGTKTARSRTISIDNETRSVMREYLEENVRSPHERIFRRADGSVLRHHHVQSAWKSARKAVGLPSYRFHDLRHAGLTMLAEAGVSLFSIMHRAGHSTITAAANYHHRSDQQGLIEAHTFEAKKLKDRTLVARRRNEGL